MLAMFTGYPLSTKGHGEILEGSSEEERREV
jgi:hypothetical protein